jgi:hypothetical protein
MNLLNIPKWLKWFFYDIRICEHKEKEWYFIDCGMGKIFYCKKCGKYLDSI